MSARWFRYYDGALDDPKVQRLPGELFKAWVNLLCLASRNDGALPSVNDIAFALRNDADGVSETLRALEDAGLLDRDDGNALHPHNWGGRQFKSDGSTERVKRFRQRSMKHDDPVPINVPKPLPATGPEQTTEQKQIQSLKKEEARPVVASPRDPILADPDNPLAYYSAGEISVLALEEGPDTEDRICELWRWACEKGERDPNVIKRMVSGRMAKDAKARREAPALREQMENPPVVNISSAVSSSRLARKDAALDRRVRA